MLSGLTPTLLTACTHMVHMVYLMGRHLHCWQPISIRNTLCLVRRHTRRLQQASLRTVHMVYLVGRCPHCLQPTHIHIYTWYAKWIETRTIYSLYAYGTHGMLSRSTPALLVFTASTHTHTAYNLYIREFTRYGNTCLKIINQTI